jgi:hypothetical protein
VLHLLGLGWFLGLVEHSLQTLHQPPLHGRILWGNEDMYVLSEAPTMPLLSGKELAAASELLEP